jgi:hypothetical protein
MRELMMSVTASMVHASAAMTTGCAGFLSLSRSLPLSLFLPLSLPLP